MTAPFPLTPEEIAALQAQAPSGFSHGRPQYGPGWAANLFGGTDPLAGGLYSPTQARAQGRRALLAAGLNILQNSGPAPYRRGLGEILAGGALAGQQAYQGNIGQTVQLQQLAQQRTSQAQMDAIRQKYAGNVSPEALTGMFHDYLSVGTPDALRAASALSEYLKSQGSVPPLQYQKDVMGPNGPVIQGRDRAGNVVTETPQFVRPTVPRSSAGSGDITARTFERSLYDPYTVKTINAYHQFQSHLAEARQGNPTAYKSAVSAFITNAEPNNQLRLGMLQYLQDVDPSLKGRADIALQRLQNGTWPDAALEGMQRVAEDNYRQLRDRTQRRYEAFRTRDPRAFPLVEPPSVRFGDDVVPSRSGYTPPP